MEKDRKEIIDEKRTINRSRSNSHHTSRQSKQDRFNLIAIDLEDEDSHNSDKEFVPRRSKKRRIEASLPTNINQNNIINIPQIVPNPPLDSDKLTYYKQRADHTTLIAQNHLNELKLLDEAEENHDPARLCWNNLNGDNERCMVLIGFSCLDFLTLLNLCENVIPNNLGRGRRSQWSSADKLLLLLCYLKHYETQAKLGETFHISKPQVNRIVASTLAAITPILYQHFVIKIESLLPELEQLLSFPDAKYVMDATVQEIWTPTGSYEEKKRFYSGKHKLYALKSLTLHNRRGWLIELWSGLPGSVHDITIATDNIDAIIKLLRKELIDEEISPGDSWEVLADAGFVGLEQQIKLVRPHKRTANKDLTSIQKEFNQSLASQRIVCERWYGRLKTRYRIMSGEYHNDRDDYSTYFRLCAALTNFHIISHPL